ncbi:cytochrome c oxidase assembly protein [Hyphomicrobium sp.]|uniref:cytochrome c oxidase assembly protein n=1 Tax=Hyphomicrobium sp. TaxID=82 RepID=UPI002D7891F1|nr:cytochrome c oxidase assembly protein [Hyphomicrobium sp.]HET6390031.1 cytochrome c oxidase assembly protein [Hyphomicrobium sp.]
MLRRLAFLTVAFAVPVTQAHAHVVGADPDVPETLRYIEMIAIASAVIVYALGVLRIRRSAGANRVVSASQTLAFSLALSLFVVILSPPVDRVTDALFSAHMVQHLVLMLFIPPLLVWSRPFLVGLWALPAAQRKAISSSRCLHVLRAMGAWLMRPVVVAALFLGAFAFWHLPRPYAWSLQNEWVHAAEHLSFLLTAIMFWSLVIEPSGRRQMDHNTSLIYVAVVAVLSGLPGALMLLSPIPLFRAHGDAPLSWGLTPLTDQQIAGVIMWVPAGIFFLVPIGLLFVRSLQSAERRAKAASASQMERTRSAG